MRRIDEQKVLKLCREFLCYDPRSGALTWNKSKGAAKAGQTAGAFSRGYVVIRLGDVLYQGHRLAWLMSYGEFPKFEIDHVDHNRSNNRLVNLRSVNRSENMKNFSLSKRNTSGVCGVNFLKDKNRWRATIYSKGRKNSLGLYRTLVEAKEARHRAEMRLGFHENHGKVLNDNY